MALISPSFNKTPSIVTPEAPVFSLIVFTCSVPDTWTSPVCPSAYKPTFPWFFTSKDVKLAPAPASTITLDPQNKLVLANLKPPAFKISDCKLLKLASLALISPSFNKTPSIVTPEAPVFSLIVSTVRVPSNVKLPELSKFIFEVTSISVKSFVLNSICFAELL